MLKKFDVASQNTQKLSPLNSIYSAAEISRQKRCRADSKMLKLLFPEKNIAVYPEMWKHLPQARHSLSGIMCQSVAIDISSKIVLKQISKIATVKTHTSLKTNSNSCRTPYFIFCFVLQLTTNSLFPNQLKIHLKTRRKILKNILY